MAEHPAVAAMPAAMRRALAQEERREEAQRLADEQDRASRAQDQEIMRQVAEHHWLDTTGHTLSEWQESRARVAEALAESGWDPAATPGSAARPAILVDGQDITPRPDVAGAAQRYQQDGLAAQLRRNRDERAAWNSAPMRAVRMRALEDEISRRGGDPADLPPPPPPGPDDDRQWEREVVRQVRAGGPDVISRAAEHLGGLTLCRVLTPEESAALPPGDW